MHRYLHPFNVDCILPRISSQLLSGGYALFEDIPFGRCEIVFSANGSELGTYTFEIRESCHG